MDGVKTFYGKIPIFLVLCLCAKICFSEDMVAPGIALTRNGAKRCDDLPIARRRKCFEDNASNHADLYGIHKPPMYINPGVMEGPGFAVENGGSRTGVISRLFNMKRFVTNVDNPDPYNIQTNFDQKNIEGEVIELLHTFCLEVPVPVFSETFDSVCNLIFSRELESKFGNEYNMFSENLPVKNSKGVISRLFNMKRFVTNVDNPDLYNIQTNFDQKNVEDEIIEFLYSVCLEIPVPFLTETFDSVCNLIFSRELESKSEKRGAKKQSGRNNGYLGGFRGGRWNVHLNERYPRKT